MSRRTLLIAVEIVTPLLVVAALWAWTAGADSYYYPPLGDVLTAFKDTWLFERFGEDVVPSLVRLGAGYAIAVVLGIALGVVLGQQVTLRKMATPVIEFLRAIPAPALIPFAILVLGVENDSKIFLIAVVCVFPILLNTIDGVASVEPTLLDTTDVYRIGALDRLRYVVLPGRGATDLRGHAHVAVAVADPDGDLARWSPARMASATSSCSPSARSSSPRCGPASSCSACSGTCSTPSSRSSSVGSWPGISGPAPARSRPCSRSPSSARPTGRVRPPIAAIGDLSFEVAAGELACIVGPSGCGKTTLLRTVSGLLAPTSGSVELDGRRVTAPPEQMALVFQDYSRSLYPWMTVAANVEFPLRRKALSKAERRSAVSQALESVGLAGFEAKYPWQLSGGMQQRVAIARGLAYRPEILLMDEPFASVDAQTRADLEDLVLKVRHDYGITILFVTHDIDESVYLADRVLILSPRPTVVQETLEVALPRPRDQVATKELPEFAQLRAHVYRAIKRSGTADGRDVQTSPADGRVQPASAPGVTR